MKHEMKAITRLLLPIYAVLVVFTVAARIVVSLDFEGVFGIIPSTVIGLYVLSLIAIAVVSTVIVILRFYKNMVTDEGYLMFTLPVKPYQLINSKLIIATLWTLLSVVAIVLSIGIVVASPLHLASFRHGLQDLMREMRNEFGAGGATLFWLETIVMTLIGTVNGILCIYACIAVGQLFNGHKVLGSFVAYIVYTVVMQVVVVVIMIVVGRLFTDYFSNITAITNAIFPVSIVLQIILSAVFYIVTNYIFNKKLNLE